MNARAHMLGRYVAAAAFDVMALVEVLLWPVTHREHR
jgi:hypothetical protein